MGGRDVAGGGNGAVVWSARDIIRGANTTWSAWSDLRIKMKLSAYSSIRKL